MKKLLCTAAALVASTPALCSATVITSGDVGNGGLYSGSVNSSNAWIASNALDGSAVNFWTFSSYADALLSIEIDSADIEFGVSVYRGLVDDLELIFSGFNNAGDFADNQFVGGTNPVVGAIGTSLVNLVLPATGFYTIAVGGEQGLDYSGKFSYTLKVAVPEPATLTLFAIALLGMGYVVRRRPD